VSPDRRPARLVVLVSGAGTNLQALLDAHDDPAWGARVVAVGADRHGTEGLARAERAGVPTFVLQVTDHHDRAGWDAAMADAVAAHEPDLVVSAGFMKLAGPAFLARFGGRYVNTHPALLPSFPGRDGVADALAHGVKVTGATLFVVDEGVDTGAIVSQVAVDVRDDDHVAALHERIKQVERAMLVDTVGRMARDGWTVHDRRVTIGMSESLSTAAGRRPIRRALVSVYDKTGLEELAVALHGAGVSIVSTGSTAARIAAAGVPVTQVEELTGFPECLDGRVKTLHPKVHAGILADTRNADHLSQLDELGIEPFDLVVSNLYPFRETVRSGAGPEEVVEQIDIGGPSMVRAAAKNHASVAIVTEPGDYPAVVQALADGGFDLAARKHLAARAFAHTASYDKAVAEWCAAELVQDPAWWPAYAGLALERAATLRYGENPHQRAALYVEPDAEPGIAQATPLHGKEMSYNNYVDADAALRAAFDFAEPAVAIIKHANPCGIAVGADIAQAHARAHACDPVSAYGGVVAANRPVTLAMAEQLRGVFTAVVVAPAFDADAFELLSRKKDVRLLELPDGYARGPVELRQVSGGVLVQTADRVDAVVTGDDGTPTGGDDPSTWTLAVGGAADAATLADLAFAWRAVRSVRSNAILLAKDGASVGVGMGQVNRVDSCRLAVERAGAERARGSVAASDAFFPFADGLEVLLAAGVTAVVQPGGSKRDPEVVEAARAAGVALYLTGTRHFAH
jgi:phosphoribosylaminoimidazolecarboxamide formyltransferase/IMP cyclohydrolase